MGAESRDPWVFHTCMSKYPGSDPPMRGNQGRCPQCRGGWFKGKQSAQRSSGNLPSTACSLVVLAFALLIPTIEPSAGQVRGSKGLSGARLAFSLLVRGRVPPRNRPALLLRGGSSEADHKFEGQGSGGDHYRASTPSHGWRYDCACP